MTRLERYALAAAKDLWFAVVVAVDTVLELGHRR